MDTIGEYEVVRRLGAGASGEVYEARERITRRRVALKVLHGALGGEPGGREQLPRQIGMLSSLYHDNVVACLACFESGGRLVMVLEFVEGRTLREELDAGTIFTATRAIGIVTQIASALAAAHAHDPPIIHRDLKPNNVLLTPDGQAKVMDFGIARLQQSRGFGGGRGTPHYRSPEQIVGGPVGPPTDLYNLGLIFYELVSGRRPFDVPEGPQLLHLQKTTRPPPLEPGLVAAMPEGLSDILLALLEKQPEARPGSARVLLTILGNVGSPSIQSTPTPAPPVSGPGPVSSSVAARTPVPTSRSDGAHSTVYLVGMLEERRTPRAVKIAIALGLGALVAAGIAALAAWLSA